jgi:hypothetical protein
MPDHPETIPSVDALRERARKAIDVYAATIPPDHAVYAALYGAWLMGETTANTAAVMGTQASVIDKDTRREIRDAVALLVFAAGIRKGDA